MVLICEACNQWHIAFAFSVILHESDGAIRTEDIEIDLFFRDVHSKRHLVYLLLGHN